jgi:alkanesulfonate monooxygenase SsuD/methylene tetrahydromethanopterin reductase-like flavin-dependent oxidoreductase (luciferase family)
MTRATSTIELGSAIAYAFGRTPLVLAAKARDLDELSGVRITLGLGTGTRRTQLDWHGPKASTPPAVWRSSFRCCARSGLAADVLAA